MKAVVKIACLTLLTGVLSGVASAQQGLPPDHALAPLRMKRVDQAHMPAADAALLRQARGRLARAARIFGYQMQEPGWSCGEAMTPDTPDYLMLGCRRPHASEKGASAFSALIARRGDAVYVVPVLFGGAAPWKTAANMKASREIFNHVVPAKIAAESMRPTGQWMTLALTYTALAGDDSVVPARPSSKLKWAMAPEPTIVLGDGSSMRKVVFSDVSPRGGVRFWTLEFNGRGRLTDAQVQVRPDPKLEAVSTESPKWRKLGKLPTPIEGVKPTPPIQP